MKWFDYALCFVLGLSIALVAVCRPGQPNPSCSCSFQHGGCKCSNCDEGGCAAQGR